MKEPFETKLRNKAYLTFIPLSVGFVIATLFFDTARINFRIFLNIDDVNVVSWMPSPIPQYIYLASIKIYS